jgi:hypothetical protein
MVRRWLQLHLLLALCWHLQHPAFAAAPHKRTPQLRNGGTTSGPGTGPSSERHHGFSGAPYSGFTTDDYDCSVHDALYGQIHADLMRFSVRGIREPNIRYGSADPKDASNQHSSLLLS